MGVVHSSVGTNNPASNNLKSEVAIVAGNSQSVRRKNIEKKILP